MESGTIESTTTDNLIKALTNVEAAIGNHAPKRGELRKKAKSGKSRSGIELENVTA